MVLYITELLFRKAQHLGPWHGVLGHQVLVQSRVHPAQDTGNQNHVSNFTCKTLWRPMCTCLATCGGQTDLTGLGQAGLSTQDPVRGRQPSNSPAGQDPDHVIGLVTFNTNCTVVKIGLCFLEQRKETQMSFTTQVQTPKQHTKGGPAVGARFLIDLVLNPAP